MKLKCFSVFDVKAGAYIVPFFMPERGQAIRTFTDSVADRNHAFGRHPEDYTLFQVGEFDDNVGEFVPCAPEALATGLAVRAVAERDGE